MLLSCISSLFHYQNILKKTFCIYLFLNRTIFSFCKVSELYHWYMSHIGANAKVHPLKHDDWFWDTLMSNTAIHIVRSLLGGCVVFAQSTEHHHHHHHHVRSIYYLHWLEQDINPRATMGMLLINWNTMTLFFFSCSNVTFSPWFRKKFAEKEKVCRKKKNKIKGNTLNYI